MQVGAALLHDPISFDINEVALIFIVNVDRS